MCLKESTTPYTSFASSSKVSVFDFCPSTVGPSTNEGSSPTATTAPVVDERVFLGLLNVDEEAAVAPTVRGATARDTASRMPPSMAGLGCLVRCQSW